MTCRAVRTRDGREPDDRALLAAHVAGDPDAFGVLFARHRDRLWAVALRTTGDPEDAADALQDAMIAAFRRAGSYRGDAAVTTWLHRIVVNACLDRLRRQQVRAADAAARRPGRATPTGLGPDRRPPRPTTRWRAAERAERQRQVLAALRQLPHEQRAALVLVDMEGYSVEEAAAILGVAVGHREEPLLPGAGPAGAAARVRTSRAGRREPDGPARVPSDEPSRGPGTRGRDPRRGEADP